MHLTSLVSTSFNNAVCFLPKCAVKQEQSLIPQKQQEWKVLKILASSLLAAALVFSPICITPVSIAQTIDARKGAALFRTSCIGCHDIGGNIIQPGATLFTKDLQRNGVDTEEEIYRVTYFGKGRMPISLAKIYYEKDLVRTAHQGANAHSELVCRMRTLSFWPNLSLLTSETRSSSRDPFIVRPLVP